MWGADGNGYATVLGVGDLGYWILDIGYWMLDVGLLRYFTWHISIELIDSSIHTHFDHFLLSENYCRSCIPG
jgi:hypothetical protein